MGRFESIKLDTVRRSTRSRFRLLSPPRLKWRQPDFRSQLLAFGIGCAVVQPVGEFAAGAGAVRIDPATDAGLAQFADQRHAAAFAGFGALHAGDDIVDLAAQLGRHIAAATAGQLAAVEGNAIVGAAGATADTGIVWVICHGANLINTPPACHLKPHLRPFAAA